MSRIALFLSLLGFIAAASGHDCPSYPASKWSFNPATLQEKLKSRLQLTNVASAFATDSGASPARQNFVDDYIFEKLEKQGVPSAPLASDAEFIRRVTIDLVGRTPAAARVRSFLEDSRPGKREIVIDELLSSSAFSDRWATWFDDLLRNTSNYPEITVAGRNALHEYLRQSIQQGKRYDEMVRDLLCASGSASQGPPNYLLRNHVSGAPSQDFFDDLGANITSTFLGIPTLCISCHSGQHHLEPINAYLSHKTRTDFWEQSAFFARTTVRLLSPDSSDGSAKYEISEAADGYYTSEIAGYPGQRPLRTGGPYMPRYLFTGEAAQGEDLRSEYARILTADFQFARNIANRMWTHFMGIGIVDPPDGFDLANYETQASHPELLDRLAQDFVDTGFDLRHLMRRIASSSAYQLSAGYPGNWQEPYSRLFARKLTRRLEAEEIHDSIVQATEAGGTYDVAGFLEPVRWAMQLPDTNEPHNSPAQAFMDLLGRGNRTYKPRDSDSSILAGLSLMNDPFVKSRTTFQADSGLARLEALPDDEIVEEIFLRTLSRSPTAEEKRVAIVHMSEDRITGMEDLQWALINRPEFILNH